MRIKECGEENTNLVSKTKSLQSELAEATAAIKKSERKFVEREKLWKADEEKHKKKLEETTKNLEAKKQSELAVLSKKCDGKVSEIKKIAKELRSKLSQKENEITKMRSEVEGTLASKTNEHDELRKQNETHVGDLNSKIDSLNDELCKKESVLKELNDEMRASREREEEGKQLIVDCDKKLNDKETELRNVKEELSEKVNQCLKLEERITGITSNHDNEVAKLSKAHKAEIDELGNDFKRKLGDREKCLEEEKNNQQILMSKDVEAKVTGMKKIVNELRSSLGECESREEILKGKLDDEMRLRAEVEKDLSDKQEHLRQLNLDVQEDQNKIGELKSQISSLNQDREVAFKEKEMEKAQWMSDMESKLNERLKEKDEFLNNTIGQLTKQNELNVDDIARNYEAIKDEQIRSLQSQQRNEIDELNGKHERSMEFLRKEAEESFEKFALESKEKEERLQRQVEDLRVSFESRRSELERCNDEVNEKLTIATKELNVKNESIRRLEGSRDEQKEEMVVLQRKMDEKLMEMIESHRQDMSKVGQEYEQHILNLSSDHANALDSHEKEMLDAKTALGRKMQEMEEDHRRELQEVKDGCAAKSQDSLEVLCNESLQLKELLEKQQHEFEKERVKAVESYESLQMLHEELVAGHEKGLVEKQQVDDKLSYLIAEHDKVKLSYEDMEGQLKVLKTEHLNEITKLNQELGELGNRKEVLEKELVANEEAFKESQVKLSETVVQNEKEYEKLLGDANQRCAKLEQELGDRNLEIEEHLKRIQEESQVEINDLKENVTCLDGRIKEMLAEHEAEVQNYKKTGVPLKKKVKALSEECKSKDVKLNESIDHYEKIILELRKQEENLKMEIASSQNDSRTVDEQVKRLLAEKQDLQTLLSKVEETHQHEM